MALVGLALELAVQAGALVGTPLFRGLDEADIRLLLEALPPRLSMLPLARMNSTSSRTESDTLEIGCCMKKPPIAQNSEQVYYNIKPCREEGGEHSSARCPAK